MGEFQELIKNFERIRDYMRQFFVYGFQSRRDFTKKSLRTYDNERRRIESFLSDYIRSGHTSDGKHLYLSVDVKTIPQNPLYAAWKCKNFTRQDLMLHFLLLDLFQEEPALSAGEASRLISLRYGLDFESQTIRLKLREYEQNGILQVHKKGKSLLYALSPPFPSPLIQPDRQNRLISVTQLSILYGNLLYACAFFQEAAPFGFVGSTILDNARQTNQWFRFRHHFIVHTLEDGVLYSILQAIRDGREIRFDNHSRRTGRISQITALPLRIFVSTRTGRRYVCLYCSGARRFVSMRLDSISNVTLLEVCPDFPDRKAQLTRNMSHCWGVSFGGPSRMEELCMKLYVNEQQEPYILDRLFREGRGGEVLNVSEHIYLYSGFWFDTNEMLSWVKTFTGRILDIQGSNRTAIWKVINDLERMYQMYCE